MEVPTTSRTEGGVTFAADEHSNIGDGDVSHRSGRTDQFEVVDENLLPSAFFTVTVLAMENVNGVLPRKDSTPPPTWAVRFAFWGEQEPVQSTFVENPTEGINFAQDYERPIEDSLFQKMVQNSLEFTVVESVLAGNEKSASNAPKTPVGVARLDPTTLFWQNDIPIVDAWLPIEPLEGISGLNEDAKIHVVLKANRPLVEEEDRSNVNVVTIHTEGIYRLPSKWVLRENQENPFTFMSRVYLPSPGGDGFIPLNMPEGALEQPIAPTPDADHDGSGSPVGNPSEKDSTSRPPSAVNRDGKDGKSGKGSKDSKDTKDKDANKEKHRGKEETTPADTPAEPAPVKPAATQQGDDANTTPAEEDEFQVEENSTNLRVTWKASKAIRYFLSGTAAEEFKSYIDGQGVSFQLRRGFSDPNEADPNARKYFGVASLMMHDLLAPGTNDITVRAPIGPYLGADPREYDDGRTPTPKLRRQAKKQSKKKRPELEVEEEDDVNPYIAAKTYCKVRFSFARPVVPALKKPKHVLKPRDIIPSRAMEAKLRHEADATQDFHSQVKHLIEQLADEYHQWLSQQQPQQQQQQGSSRADDEDGGGSGTGSGTGGAAGATDSVGKERAAAISKANKTRFLHELNTNGKYFAFKEKLKKSVIRIVREKFHKNSPGSKEDFATFYNELYIYLVENMHECMNKFVASKTAPITKADTSNNVQPVTLETLKRIADEAELKSDYALAARYHQDRVSMDKDNTAMWYDYGTFAIRAGDMPKAEQCFRECIAIDNTHLPTLLAYGALLLSREEYDKAEVFLKGATDEHENSMVAWTLRGILYDAMGLEDEAEPAHKSASRIREAEGTKDSPNIVVARLLLDLHLTHVAEKALSHELLSMGPSLETTMLLGKMYTIRKDYSRAEELYGEAIKLSHTHVEAWRQLGHVHFLQDKFPDARSAYETALSLTTSHPIHVLLRLAQTYWIAEMWTEAKDMYMQACRASPTASSWLGVGMSFYQMGDYAHAEDALAEANILDNRRPEVWGYLTLVCLQTDRPGEADLSLKQAFRFDLHDGPLLCNIGEMYFLQGEYEIAERCLRKSVDAHERVHVRRLLADVLYATGDPERTQQAINEYKWVVDNYESDQDRAHAIHQLISILQADESSAAEAAEYQQLLDTPES